MSRSILASLFAVLAALVISGTAHALPKEVQRDMHVLGLGKALKAENYAQARKHIEVLNALGVDLPPAVLYFGGETYYQTCDAAKAKDAVNRYLTATGNKGRYYKKALELLMTLEAGTPSAYCLKYREAHEKERREELKKEQAAHQKQLKKKKAARLKRALATRETRKAAFEAAFLSFRDYLNSSTFNWNCYAADPEDHHVMQRQINVTQNRTLSVSSPAACKISIKYKLKRTGTIVKSGRPTNTDLVTSDANWDLLRDTKRGYSVKGETITGKQSHMRDWKGPICPGEKLTYVELQNTRLWNRGLVTKWRAENVMVFEGHPAIRVPPSVRTFYKIGFVGKGEVDVGRLKASLKAMMAVCDIDQ